MRPNALLDYIEPRLGFCILIDTGAVQFPASLPGPIMSIASSAMVGSPGFSQETRQVLYESAVHGSA